MQIKVSFLPYGTSRGSSSSGVLSTVSTSGESLSAPAFDIFKVVSSAEIKDVTSLCLRGFLQSISNGGGHFLEKLWCRVGRGEGDGGEGREGGG